MFPTPPPSEVGDPAPNPCSSASSSVDPPLMLDLSCSLVILKRFLLFKLSITRTVLLRIIRANKTFEGLFAFCISQIQTLVQIACLLTNYLIWNFFCNFLFALYLSCLSKFVQLACSLLCVLTGMLHINLLPCFLAQTQAFLLTIHLIALLLSYLLCSSLLACDFACVFVSILAICLPSILLTNLLPLLQFSCLFSFLFHSFISIAYSFASIVVSILACISLFCCFLPFCLLTSCFLAANLHQPFGSKQVNSDRSSMQCKCDTNQDKSIQIDPIAGVNGSALSGSNHF